MTPTKRCYASFDNFTLTIGNDHLERQWRLQAGRLRAVSWLDKRSGRQWITAPTKGSTLLVEPIASADAARFSMIHDDTHAVEKPSLLAELTIGQGDRAITLRFRIFDDSAAITLSVTAPASAGINTTAQRDQSPTGIEIPAESQSDPRLDLDVVDAFHIRPQHVRVIHVDLRDQTDVHNNLLFEQEWLMHTCEPLIELRGNILILEDILSREGLILLKEAPLPHARPLPNPVDFLLRHGDVGVLGHGIEPAGGESYPLTTLCYQGGRASRIAALQRYQRQRRPLLDGRDGLFVSNTWGDRNKDGRVCDDFIRQEIHAGEKLGVDVIQIDDGWQRGRTANSIHAGGVWSGFWSADDRFWDHHPERFPEGLESLIADAAARGMQFGLWFAPDSSSDFANWRRDGEQLLALHRRLDVNYFKIDGVKATTRPGERNLRRFFDHVLTGSAGKVVFDLDVTAEIRPGYFGMMNVGAIFVENRYTDWHRYWPHHTLRNFWQLSHYIDPVRLRMEFLNNTRQTQQYPDDPLEPARYAPAYLFATVMAASPLGWFEVSQLPESYRAEVASLVRVWKAHRAAFHGGTLLPIGEPPDGVSWTGFASASKDGNAGYLLAFREWNDRPSHRFEIPLFPAGKYRAQTLAGSGRVELSRNQALIQIDSPGQFVFARVQA